MIKLDSEGGSLKAANSIVQEPSPLLSVSGVRLSSEHRDDDEQYLQDRKSHEGKIHLPPDKKKKE